MADPSPPRSVDPLLEVRQRRRGQRPGDAYVKIVRPYEDVFERGEEGGLVATERTILDRRGWRAGLRRLRTFLIGRPISSEREAHERLTRTKALAIFSSDNISSSAYATEEMMRILVLAGIGAITLAMPLTIVICVVLAIVATSYWQTIRAYPNGASSYLVTSDNLGDRAGLVAGASLLIDYTLTVAVSVSAAVAAITSVVPELFGERVLIGVGIVVVLMLGNLRGIRESGTIFMAPTYLYIGIVLGMIGIGVARTLTGTLPDYVPPAGWLAAEGGGEALGILLVLRAFSSGAAALTGVEAISDGVPAFKPPEWRNARITLVWAAAIFALLFLGISFLASAAGILPDPGERQTVLSQIARLVYGDGFLFVLTQVATVLVLALAANTAFADFPRLSSFLARDSFMPRQFAFRGERLAFTTGIVALSGLAVLLLVVFGASVTALIPLYTLGVFIAFTLSQSSMVRRWWSRREDGWRRGLVINGAGALTTGVIALIVIESKFLSGAWMVIVAIPLLVLLMVAIRSHYRTVDRRLATPAAPVAARVAEPIVVVPISRLNEPARLAIAFATSISTEATAVHVTHDLAAAERMRDAWPAWAGGARLVIIESPYRALIGPLLSYLDVLQQQDPTRPVLVVLSEFVPRHWWENLLHNQTALRLKLRLFARPNTMVTDVPYHLAADVRG
ncbi:MAG TPA: APC family permease [Candidatus Limnocylindria bacterium]|nr:APC family permease [Candidatus Limnocylindria bacterium]